MSSIINLFQQFFTRLYIQMEYDILFFKKRKEYYMKKNYIPSEDTLLQKDN